MNRIMLLLAATTLVMIVLAGGSVRQSPPEPNCTLEPELCTKSTPAPPAELTRR